MADTDKKILSPADEIEELKRQMEAMRARLTELGAAMERGETAESADRDGAEEDPSENVGSGGASDAEDDPCEAGPVPEVEPVAVPGPTAPVVESSQEYAAYVPPAAPSAYAASQSADQGAPTPPPAYDASAAGGAQGVAGSGVEYGQTTGQQAYQSGGYAGGYGASPQTPYNPYGQNYYQQPVVRTKDHVAAGLLGIFLGTFGIHKFYLGYNTSGFIMLGVAILGGLLSLGLATGVVWLIGLIEGIIYLVKGQAEFEQTYVFGKREWF